jgi:hypothetical protein
MKNLFESIEHKKDNLLMSKRSWMRIVEAFIAVILIMTIMVIVIQRQNIGNNSLEEIQIKQKNILNLVSRDEVLRGELLSWKAELTNEKIKYLVPQGYNYSIELCKYDSICSLNFTVKTDVFSDETLIVANLTHYMPDEAVKLKLFFWRGPFPEGQQPHNYSEPFPHEEGEEPVCSDQCSAGAITCIDLTHFKVCGNFDADTCLEWNTTATPCGNNQMCVVGGCVQAVPVFNAPVVWNLQKANATRAGTCTAGYIKWNYDMNITETGGITGATFASRHRWIYSDEPKTIDDGLKTTMPTGMPTSISAGQTIIVKDRYVCLLPNYNYWTIEYFYKDTSGTQELFNYTVTGISN